MIACSIALAIWTAGLSFLTHKDEKKRAAIEAAEASAANSAVYKTPEDV